jgi:hypothetical protein
LDLQWFQLRLMLLLLIFLLILVVLPFCFSYVIVAGGYKLATLPIFCIYES